MPDNHSYIALILIFSITCTVLVISIIFIILGLINHSKNKYFNFVIQNSIYLKNLQTINTRYTFFPNLNFDQSYTYDNEVFFNSISCSDYLIYQLQYISRPILTQINKIKHNSQQYSKYLDELNAIKQYGQFSCPIRNLKLNKLKKTELKIIANQTLCPHIYFSLKVTLYCTTINGKIYNAKSQIFSAEDIIFFTKQLNNKTGNFYNDRQLWESLCRVERGKVSNRMRFSIYKRDGYKCRKCGISGKSVQLEIDHIIPVSKGGKSTYDNLQTLCHKCNLEKGNTTRRY